MDGQKLQYANELDLKISGFTTYVWFINEIFQPIFNFIFAYILLIKWHNGFNERNLEEFHLPNFARLVRNNIINFYYKTKRMRDKKSNTSFDVAKLVSYANKL